VITEFTLRDMAATAKARLGHHYSVANLGRLGRILPGCKVVGVGRIGLHYGLAIHNNLLHFAIDRDLNNEDRALIEFGEY
jgi:hypothetical protein